MRFDPNKEAREFLDRSYRHGDDAERELARLLIMAFGAGAIAGAGSTPEVTDEYPPETHEQPPARRVRLGKIDGLYECRGCMINNHAHGPYDSPGSMALHLTAHLLYGDVLVDNDALREVVAGLQDMDVQDQLRKATVEVER